MSNYRFTKLAELDLEDIYDQIFLQNQAAALKLLIAIEERCKTLVAAPNSGRKRDELLEGMRSVAFGNYVIFYKARPEDILVIRIFHCRRDTDRFFEPGAIPEELEQ